ncbi:tyrosine-type recombinase/integrase [Desulfosediminicola ganghwensis]|uniref:tyrosine-type recombinase/integrase n=1 Tax=Desulfosediminicola ganghwensis TaxID=2569540 RepID=UPI00142EA9E8|nr:site-specific integrase [Desulfosediminicola ganghwensis]
MPKINFTPLTIKNLKAEPKTVEYFEQGRKHGEGSFGLRISPKDKRTWFIMYKTESNKVKRFTLGTYPKLSLKDARKLAADTMARIHEGHDPMQEQVIRRSAPTVSDLWEEYQATLNRKAKKKVASTEYEENRRWTKIISPALGDMKVEDITPIHISSLLNKVAAKAPISANRLHTLLRVMFKVALANGWINIHPMQWLDKPGGSEPARKRFLTDDEIRCLWPHFERLRPNPRDILKIGILTAQRPGEILAMKWEHLDLNSGVWTLKDTKNGNDHLLPLSHQVLSILRDRKEGVGFTKKMLWMKESEFVFPSRYNLNKGANSGHAKSTKEARKKVQQASGVTDWTAHDLRRTARTIMSRLNIKHHIRERVLNHAQGGIQGVYDRYDYLQEKADALNKLANEIDRILGKEKTAKIIELKTA